MSAGTLTLVNDSDSVSGAGTVFSTELTAGDFVVVTVGGIPYTLPVKSIESDTALTLVSKFTGPAQPGAAWYAVPRAAMNLVTAAVVTQAAEALRGLNYDKQNWQSLFSSTGDITVRLPDGSTFTGPAWNSFATALSGKAAKGANSDITSLTGLTTALTLEQGGTGATTAAAARTKLELGNSATKNVGSTTGTVAAGDDSRLGTINGKTGGTLSTGITFNGATGFKRQLLAGSDENQGGEIRSYLDAVNNGAGGTYRSYYASVSGVTSSFVMICDTNATFIFGAGGGATALNGQWINGSDERIKDKIQRIDDPLGKMSSLKGCTWSLKSNGNFGIGFIAQDVEKVFPGAVKESYFPQTFPDGTKLDRVKALNAGDVAAALHHESILQLMDIVKEAIATIASVTTDEGAKAALEALAERIPASDPS